MQEHIIFRMSNAGKCPRALSAQLLGMEAEPIPEFVSRAAEEGNWHEGRIVSQLEQEGQFVDCRQKEHILEYPSFNLIGHIDGVIIKQPQLATKEDLDAEGDGKWQLLEIKTMSQFEFNRWMKGGFKAFPQYADQVTCYMEATKLNRCLYVVKNRSSGYEDRQVLIEPPSDIDAIVNKLTAVIDWLGKNIELGAREGFYPADFDPQSIECRRCEYKQLCIPEPKELTPQDEAKLSMTIQQWRDGKSLIEEGNELVGGAKEILEEHTRATNQPKWSLDKLAIQLVRYNESITYPKAKLLKEFTKEQLEPASQIKEAYDQLRITDLEEDNE